MSISFRNWFLVIAVFALMFLSAPRAFAAAQAADTYTPPAVPSIDVKNTRYIFNQPSAGMVTAWDVPSGKKLWEKTLYATAKIDKPTKANHPVYINKATLNKNTIEITSESGGKYTISISDPKNPSVTNLTTTRSIGLIILVVALVAAGIIWLKMRQRKRASKSEA